MLADGGNHCGRLSRPLPLLQQKVSSLGPLNSLSSQLCNPLLPLWGINDSFDFGGYLPIEVNQL